MVISDEIISKEDETVGLSPPDSSKSPIKADRPSDDDSSENDLESLKDHEITQNLQTTTDQTKTANTNYKMSDSIITNTSESINEQKKDTTNSDYDYSDKDLEEEDNEHQAMNPESNELVYVNRTELKELQTSIMRIQDQQIIQMKLIEQIQHQLNTCIQTQNEYKATNSPIDKKNNLFSAQNLSEDFAKLVQNDKYQQLSNSAELTTELLLKAKNLKRNSESPVSNNGSNDSNESAESYNSQYKSKKLIAAASLHKKRLDTENNTYQISNHEDESDSDEYDAEKSNPNKRFKLNSAQSAKPPVQQQLLGIFKRNNIFFNFCPSEGFNDP